MANIADAAGMSRPALYQYFRNKSDIFASAFVALFDDHVDRALQALDDEGTTAERLDGFLQRFEGDLWEQMAASEHSEEIMSAKTADTAEERRMMDLVGDRIEVAIGIANYPSPDIHKREDLYAAAREAFLDARHAGGGVVVSAL